MPRLPTAATPFVLGRACEKQDFALVRKQWQKNCTRRIGKGGTSHAIMGRVQQQIRHDGYVLRERYRFALAEVLSPPDGAGPDEVAGALQQLLALTFVFEEPNQAGFHLMSLLDTTKEHPVSHDGHAITVVLNPQLRNYLLNVARVHESPAA